ncbi:MAG: biotin--[acetyl-CoA-carboxylase] ligase [Coxiellaceae bacterium]|nr:biotin--[acetyl-CoA-carboxylase] ligase [Coxiellaceae bacterium]
MRSLNAEKIQAGLNTLSRKKIDDIRLFDSVTSTNDLALIHAKEHPDRNTVFLAETQTAGRGRFDRQWISPKNNIYCSLTWRFKKKISEITGLSVKIGEALQLALKNYGIKENIYIKLPNDLFFENKKLAGILIETFTLDASHCIAVIGFGLNVEPPENTVGIDQPWTSLAVITKTSHDRNQLTAEIINSICKTLE